MLWRLHAPLLTRALPLSAVSPPLHTHTSTSSDRPPLRSSVVFAPTQGGAGPPHHPHVLLSLTRSATLQALLHLVSRRLILSSIIIGHQPFPSLRSLQSEAGEEPSLAVVGVCVPLLLQLGDQLPLLVRELARDLHVHLIARAEITRQEKRADDIRHAA